MTEEGTWLFTRYESYLLPQNIFLIDFIDGFIIYGDFNEDYTETVYGVIKPDHLEIIPPVDVALISPAIRNGTVAAFIINTNMMHGMLIHETYTQARYILVNPNGNTFKTGLGFATYDDALGLFCIQGNDYYAWIDMSGRVLTSIALMSYSFD